MAKQHSRRNRAEISCSLHPSDLAIGAPVSKDPTSVIEPAIMHWSARDQWHFGLMRECLELKLNTLGVASLDFALPSVETVGCLFEPSTQQVAREPV
jgi:hypothetical protein